MTKSVSIPFKNLKLALLYPSDYFTSHVHPMYIRESEVFKSKGIEVYTFCESITDRRFLIHKEAECLSTIPRGIAFLYRGHILGPTEYYRLDTYLKNYGSYLLIRPQSYSKTTFNVSWYDILVDPYSGFPPLTTRTLFIHGGDDDERLLDNILFNEKDLITLGKVFIKDWVKAVKPVDEYCIYPTASSEHCLTAIDLLRKKNVRIYGGLAVRKFTKFEPDSLLRVFVLNGNQYITNNGSVYKLNINLSGEELSDRLANIFISKPEFNNCCYDSAISQFSGERIVVDIGSICCSSLDHGWDDQTFSEVINLEFSDDKNST